MQRKGWLAEEIKNANEDFDTWPNWLKLAADFDVSEDDDKKSRRVDRKTEDNESK